MVDRVNFGIEVCWVLEDSDPRVLVLSYRVGKRFKTRFSPTRESPMIEVEIVGFFFFFVDGDREKLYGGSKGNKRRWLRSFEW